MLSDSLCKRKQTIVVSEGRKAYRVENINLYIII